MAVIAAVAAVWRALPRRWRDPAIALPVVLVPLFVLYPLQPLWRYYAHEGAKDPNSASFLAAVAAIDAARGGRTPVWIDKQLEKTLLNDGSQALDVLDYLLTLDRVPHVIVEDPERELRRVVPTLDPADRESHPIVIMSRDRCWPLRGQVAMERISDTLLLNELFRYFAVYRWAAGGGGGGVSAAGGDGGGVGAWGREGVRAWGREGVVRSGRSVARAPRVETLG